MTLLKYPHENNIISSAKYL